MQRFTLSWGSFSCQILSKQDLGAHPWGPIRGLRLTATDDTSGRLPAVIHEPSPGEPEIILDGHEFHVRGPGDWPTPDGLLFLAFVLIEHQMNLCGHVLLHAACVERGGRALCLVGPHGAGKTTIATSLCRERGFRLIGGDLVVLQHAGTGVTAEGGSGELALRPAMLGQLGLPRPGDRGPKRWAHISIDPGVMQIESVDRARIAGLSQVFLDRQDRRLSRDSADPGKLRRFLYTSSSQNVCGVSVLSASEGEPWRAVRIPSVDTDVSHARRVQLLDVIAAGATRVGGGLDEICNALEAQLLP